MKFLLAALAAVFIASPAVSEVLVLECSVPETPQGGGYISDLYYFEIDMDAGKALALDAWIMHYFDDPISVKVSEDTNKKLVLTWNLQTKDGAGQLTKMQYRAAYFKGTKELLLRAVPGGGYSNVFEGRGKCKTL